MNLLISNSKLNKIEKKKLNIKKLFTLFLFVIDN